LAEEAADQGCGVILVTGHGKFHEDVEKSGHRYLFNPSASARFSILSIMSCARRKRAAS
jgi:hypothetical protein